MNLGVSHSNLSPAVQACRVRFPVATTVSGVADASGGIGAGNLVEADLDNELFKFKSDDTPLYAADA